MSNLRSFLVGTLLLALGSVVLAEGSDDFDPAEAWQRFEQESDLPAFGKAMSVVAAVFDDSGEISDALCEEKYAQLQELLAQLPVSVGAWKIAMECAERLGKEEDAALAEQRILQLLRHGLAIHNNRPNQAIPALNHLDVMSIVELSQLEFLYAFYQADAAQGNFPLIVGLRDPLSNIERELVFDYFGGLIRAVERDQSVPSISGRRQMFRSVLKVLGEAGDTAAALLGQILELVDSGEYSGPKVRALADPESAESAVVVAIYCMTDLSLNCGTDVADLLLPAVEAKMGRAMITLAVIHAQGLGVEPDLEFAARLLRAGEARMPVGVGASLFQILWNVRDRDSGIHELVRDQIEQAARRGEMNPLVLSYLAHDQQRDYPKWMREQFQRQADAGVPFAQFALSQIYQDVGDDENGRIWLSRAAESGLPTAQAQYADAFVDGELGVRPDSEQARAWRQRAARMGNLRSMATLARQLIEADPLEQQQLGMRWLFAAIDAGDEASTMLLASLYRRGAAGLKSNPARALEIYKSLGERHQVQEARGQAYLMLRFGDGVEVDLAAAEDQMEAMLAASSDPPNEVSVLSREQMAQEKRTIGELLQEMDDRKQRRKRGNLLGELAFSLYHANAFERRADWAVELWNEAVELGSQTANNTLAWTWCVTADSSYFAPEKGLALIQELTASEPDNAAFLDTEAVCLAQLGRTEEALAVSKRALKLARKKGPEAARYFVQVRQAIRDGSLQREPIGAPNKILPDQSAP